MIKYKKDKIQGHTFTFFKANSKIFIALSITLTYLEAIKQFKILYYEYK